MVTSLEEWGYRGAFKFIAPICRIFGLFPLTIKDEPRVLSVLKYYGLFVIIPWINSLLVFSVYREILNIIYGDSTPIGPVMVIIYIVSCVSYMNFAVWTASTRTYTWLSCYKTVEKLLIRTKKTEQREIFRCKLITLYVIILTSTALAENLEKFMYTKEYSFLTFFLKLNLAFFNGMTVSMDSLIFTLLMIRVHAASKIMNEELKRLLYKSHAEKVYSLGSKPILKNNYLIGSDFNKANKCDDSADKFRTLAHSYMAICDVIKTVMDTGETGIIFYIISFLLRLMTRSYDYFRLQYNNEAHGNIIFTSVIELLWSGLVIIKFCIYCEAPHQIHNELQETQDLISRLKKKYHEDISVSNELRLFFRLTVLCRPTFSPLNICTINRGLVAKIVGCAATYLLAFIQLELNKKPS